MVYFVMDVLSVLGEEGFWSDVLEWALQQQESQRLTSLDEGSHRNVPQEVGVDHQEQNFSKPSLTFLKTRSTL